MGNMFKKVKAKTVAEYLAAVPAEHKKDILFLHKFIQKTVPSLKSHFASNMLGYGSFKYTNYKKEVIDWPIVALANQKNYISLYVCAVEGSQYLAEKHAQELGKVSVGRNCIRFKKVADVNLKTLEQVIKKAAKNPGLRKE